MKKINEKGNGFEFGLRPVIFSSKKVSGPWFFWPTKSICLVIFSTDKSIRPVIYGEEKSVRPVIFGVQKSVRLAVCMPGPVSDKFC